MNSNPKYRTSSEVKILQAQDMQTALPLDIYSSKISAGFPSPAESYLEGQLDLNEQLIKNPPATFFVRVSGDSMIGAGIYPEDLLVVDRSEEPKNGKVVLAVVNGDMTVKRLQMTENGVTLLPENSNYAPLRITDEMEFSIWGVVTFVVHQP